MATGAAPPKKVFRHPWRAAIVAIALLVVLNLGIVLAMSSDTSEPGRERLPDTVETITPEPGELTGLVDDVSVDLRNDLTGVLVIDGVEVPEDQLDRVENLGIVTFRPGPEKDLPRFSAGDHTVVVRYWDKAEERPADPPGYSWSFRAAA